MLQIDNVCLYMSANFIIEQGIDIYDKPRRKRSGKWKEVAMRMQPPWRVDGKLMYDSISHSDDGEHLTLKQAIALTNALHRLGHKAVTRKNEQGYRVWRTT